MNTWARLLEVEMLAAADCWTPPTNPCNCRSQSSGLRSSWHWLKGGRSCTAVHHLPWKVTTYSGSNLRWGYIPGTLALSANTAHTLLIPFISVQKASSSSTATLPWDIFKLCPQCLRHPTHPTPSTATDLGLSNQSSLLSNSIWSSFTQRNSIKSWT